MAKRKLTRRQEWRINKIQEERTRRAEKNAGCQDRPVEEGELGPEQQGLVIAHYGSQLDVEALEGDNCGQVQRCHSRANLAPLVTGDKIIWRPGKPTGVIVAQLARHSELVRPDASGQLKPVASNIDHIIIVIAPTPQPHANLIDRYLVAAENCQIKPIVLLNKVDLINGENRDSISKLLEIYPELGYQLISSSIRASDGLDQLQTLLLDKTSVFVGQSGVGKSSLINALIPEATLRIGALSKGAEKGTHTTTTAQLFHYKPGGELIDSPGIREFGLWHMSDQDLLEGFVDFSPFLGHCKFRDCRHEKEPGCALLGAVEEGKISRRRMASYQHIKGSLGSKK